MVRYFKIKSIFNFSLSFQVSVEEYGKMVTTVLRPGNIKQNVNTGYARDPNPHKHKYQTSNFFLLVL